jgi:hypothetical protein
VSSSHSESEARGSPPKPPPARRLRRPDFPGLGHLDRPAGAGRRLHRNPGLICVRALARSTTEFGHDRPPTGAAAMAPRDVRIANLPSAVILLGLKPVCQPALLGRRRRVATLGDEEWSPYGASWLQPVASGGQSRGARTGRKQPNRCRGLRLVAETSAYKRGVRPSSVPTGAQVTRDVVFLRVSVEPRLPEPKRCELNLQSRVRAPLRVNQSSIAATATNFSPPSLIQRSSGDMCSSKKSRLQPSHSAASAGRSARRGGLGPRVRLGAWLSSSVDTSSAQTVIPVSRSHAYSFTRARADTRTVSGYALVERWVDAAQTACSLQPYRLVAHQEAPSRPELGGGESERIFP